MIEWLTMRPLAPTVNATPTLPLADRPEILMARDLRVNGRAVGGEIRAGGFGGRTVALGCGPSRALRASSRAFRASRPPFALPPAFPPARAFPLAREPRLGRRRVRLASALGSGRLHRFWRGRGLWRRRRRFRRRGRGFRRGRRRRRRLDQRRSGSRRLGRRWCRLRRRGLRRGGRWRLDRSRGRCFRRRRRSGWARPSASRLALAAASRSV